MKMQILLSATCLLTSLFSFAVTEYIACGSPGERSYNIALQVEDGQIQTYSTVESSLQSFSPITLQSDFPMIRIEYTEYNDTHFGYLIQMQTVIKGQFQIVAWTSGNDSDNYYPVQNSSPVACHILKSKPRSAAVSPSNIEQAL
jgi:hypothetical protein